MGREIEGEDRGAEARLGPEAGVPAPTRAEKEEGIEGTREKGGLGPIATEKRGPTALIEGEGEETAEA